MTINNYNIKVPDITANLDSGAGIIWTMSTKDNVSTYQSITETTLTRAKLEKFVSLDDLTVILDPVCASEYLVLNKIDFREARRGLKFVLQNFTSLLAHLRFKWSGLTRMFEARI